MASGGGSSSDLEAHARSGRTTSVSRGSMTTKQVQGLSLDQVKEALLGLLPEHAPVILEKVINPLCPPLDHYRKACSLLRENMERGLSRDAHDEAPVAMYHSFVRDVPNGTENCRSLALDFGSHHLRLELVTLNNGQCEVDSKNGFVPEKLLSSGTGEQLFDYIAGFLHRFLKQRDLLNTASPLPLGFTFAFPCRRLALNRAILTRWTKSLHCEGVEGQEIGAMLEEAIFRKGEMNVVLDAIVNDTVATLMAGAQDDPSCVIGLILSKGTNACYMERIEKVGTWTGDTEPPLQVVIDTEWEMFGSDGCLDYMRSSYDYEVDKHSKHPGKSIYEKMQSGQYLGEQVRLVLNALKENDVILQEHWTPELDTRGRFYTKYVSEVLSEEDIRFLHTRHVYEELNVRPSELECRVLHHVCHLVSTRAATMAAVGLACLIEQVDRQEVGIAVDGALYLYHPTFKQILQANIPTFLSNGKQFRLVHVADGTCRGAALAAAVTERIKRDKAAPIMTCEATSGADSQSGQSPGSTDSVKPDQSAIESQQTKTETPKKE